jgi:hypothetical protein
MGNCSAKKSTAIQKPPKKLIPEVTGKSMVRKDSFSFEETGNRRPDVRPVLKDRPETETKVEEVEVVR